MIGITIIWLFIIAVEIFRNWCIIEVGKRRPTYWWSNVIRVAVGFLFWVLAKAFINISAAQWWAMIPMMLLTFWWCFDYGLNQFRNMMNRLQRSGVPPIFFAYLNPKGSWLDQYQYHNWPGIVPWFYIKASLMLVSILITFLL